MLKTRLDKPEHVQLSNNVMVMGIQEDPFEQYSTTKLHIKEMIVATIQSGNSSDDLETAKKVEITNCSRVDKYRHNFPQADNCHFCQM